MAMNGASLPSLVERSFSKISGTLSSEFEALRSEVLDWQKRHEAVCQQSLKPQASRNAVVDENEEVVEYSEPFNVAPLPPRPSANASSPLAVVPPLPSDHQHSLSLPGENSISDFCLNVNEFVSVNGLGDQDRRGSMGAERNLIANPPNQRSSLQSVSSNRYSGRSLPALQEGSGAAKNRQETDMLAFGPVLSSISSPLDGDGSRPSRTLDIPGAKNPGAKDASPAERRHSNMSHLSHVSIFEDDGPLNLEPHDIFMNGGLKDKSKMSRVTSRLRKSTTKMMSMIYQDDLQHHDDEDDKELSWEEQIVLQPGSVKSIIWESIGGFIVFFDFIILPLSFCSDAELMPGTNAMLAHFFRAYWTLDIAVSFITGYLDKTSKPETRLTMIAARYAKTWLTFDAALVISDWATFSMEAEETKSALRFARMIRLLRLVRLVQGAQKILVYVTVHVRSEGIMVFIELLKVICSCLLLIHPGACIFYAVGNRVDRTGWVHFYEINTGDLWSRYITACHWSMSQLSGDANLMPQNSEERSYATAALLMAYVLSALIVSNLTTLMTRMQLITAHHKRQINILQRYLLDNQVSTRLATRILDHATDVIEEKRQTPPEEMVELLQELSNPLQIELRYEVYSKILVEHPFFNGYNRSNPAGMRAVCHQALAKHKVAQGDVVFSAGHISETPQMYFVVRGTVVYTMDNHTVSLVPGEFLNEVVLWTQWPQHIGSLHASEDSVLVGLKASEFLRSCDQYHTRGEYPTQYAKKFVAALNDSDKSAITEVFTDFIDAESLAREVFGPNLIKKSRRKSEKNTLTRASRVSILA